jgi:hypothetical protein
LAKACARVATLSAAASSSAPLLSLSETFAVAARMSVTSGVGAAALIWASFAFRAFTRWA